MDIKLKVLDLSYEEKIFVKAVNQYLLDYNKKLYVESSWGMVYKTSGATNGVLYYVYLKEDLIYAIYKDDSVKEYTKADVVDETTYNLFQYALLTDGVMVSTDILY